MGYKQIFKLFGFRSGVISLLFTCFLIILLGFVVYYIDSLYLINHSYAIALIVSIALLKCIYFVTISYHKILEISLKSTAYYDFILFMATNITIIILSFSCDFFCMLQVDPLSLKGMDPNSPLFNKGFDCFYFSALNFSFFGYSDILPASIPAKIIMLFETFLSFLAIIVVMSDFISLKESIYQRNKKKQNLQQ